MDNAVATQLARLHAAQGFLTGELLRLGSGEWVIAARLVRTSGEVKAANTVVRGKANAQTLTRAAEALTAQLLGPAPPLPQSGEGFSDRLQAGGTGPLLVVVPAGTFAMGSPVTEWGRDADEGPQHPVRISAFALGKQEVSNAEFRRFQPQHDSGTGLNDPAQPVVRLSWEDAQAYVRWLSAQTGKTYRLPSEAEWEYAARAGSTTAFATGACLSLAQANVAGGERYAACPTEAALPRKALPSGAFAANAWGLQELHGNVWEWVEDCWHPDYQGAPTDGSAWLTGGDCQLRVLRGGSWFNPSRFARAALRAKIAPSRASYDLGLRVARTLETPKP